MPYSAAAVDGRVVLKHSNSGSAIRYLGVFRYLGVPALFHLSIRPTSLPATPSYAHAESHSPFPPLVGWRHCLARVAAVAAVALLGVLTGAPCIVYRVSYLVTPAQLNRIMMVTNELMEGVDDPWSNMEVRINQRQAGAGAAGMQLQREWTKDEDRYLLCLTHL